MPSPPWATEISVIDGKLMRESELDPPTVKFIKRQCKGLTLKDLKDHFVTKRFQDGLAHILPPERVPDPQLPRKKKRTPPCPHQQRQKRTSVPGAGLQLGRKKTFNQFKRGPAATLTRHQEKIQKTKPWKSHLSPQSHSNPTNRSTWIYFSQTSVRKWTAKFHELDRCLRKFPHSKF